MEDEINHTQKEKSTLLLQIRKTKTEIEELQKKINQTCQEDKSSSISDQDALMYPNDLVIKCALYIAKSY
jgi:hypothetical protein